MSKLGFQIFRSCKEVDMAEDYSKSSLKKKSLKKRRAKRKEVPYNSYSGKQYQGIDPLSQTFKVDEDGAFLTSVDLFFARKDPNENISVEIRTTELGIPTTQIVQDFARVV